MCVSVCVCTVDYTDYTNYRYLDEDDTDTLLKLVFLFRPEELIDKVFFQNDRLCGSSTNEFYKLENISDVLGVTNSVLRTKKTNSRQHYDI